MDVFFVCRDYTALECPTEHAHPRTVLLSETCPNVA